MRAPELANARTVMLLAGAAFLVLPAAAFVGVMPADAWIRGALFDGAMPGLIRVMRWINYARSSWVILPGALLLLALERVWRGVVDLDGGDPGRVAPGARAQGSGGAAAPGESCVRLSQRARYGGRGALVALARILLRAHWPSDVLGSIALGLKCVAAAAALTAASTARRPAAPTSPETPGPG